MMPVIPLVIQRLNPVCTYKSFFERTLLGPSNYWQNSFFIGSEARSASE